MHSQLNIEELSVLFSLSNYFNFGSTTQIILLYGDFLQITLYNLLIQTNLTNYIKKDYAFNSEAVEISINADVCNLLVCY